MRSLRSLRALALALVVLPVAPGSAPGSAPREEIAVATTGGGIVLVDAQGRRIRALTSPRDRSSSDWAPAWSPDGERIAFTRTTDGRRSFRVYVMRADGSGVRQLTRGRFDDEPAWSPDGRWIAYRSSGGIRLVRPAGGRPRAVGGTGTETANCSSSFASSPSWTRSGLLSYAFHPDPPGDWPASCRKPGARCGWVWTVRLDGSGGRPLVRGRDAHWSPDGRRVVYTPPDGGVAVVPAGGGRPRLLGRGYLADWSRDGMRIVFARLGLTARGDSIWVMNADGSGRRRLLDGATTPAWRPG